MESNCENNFNVGQPENQKEQNHLCILLLMLLELSFCWV